jgi:hypothetical protein
MNRNRLILLSVVAGTMAVFVPLAMGSSSPGCEPVVNAPIESDQFTPYEVRRSKLPEPILNPEGEPLPAGLDAPTSIEGLALRWQDGSNPDGSPVALYFSDGPLVGTPLSTFFKSGGVQLTEEPVDGGVIFAETLKEEVGERATPVQIGPYAGVMTWADPDSHGIRTHNLYWSDGTTNFSLIALRPALDLLTAGRSLVCDGTL